ncbi:hypothetical protein PMIN04_013252 [Paraphaeosphaeria minitans]
MWSNEPQRRKRPSAAFSVPKFGKAGKVTGSFALNVSRSDRSSLCTLHVFCRCSMRSQARPEPTYPPPPVYPSLLLMRLLPHRYHTKPCPRVCSRETMDKGTTVEANVAAPLRRGSVRERVRR